MGGVVGVAGGVRESRVVGRWMASAQRARCCTWADAAGALSHGLSVPAFARKDAMSDWLCSLLCDSLFLVSDDVPRMNHKNPTVIKTIY